MMTSERARSLEESSIIHAGEVVRKGGLEAKWSRGARQRSPATAGRAKHPWNKPCLFPRGSFAPGVQETESAPEGTTHGRGYGRDSWEVGPADGGFDGRRISAVRANIPGRSRVYTCVRRDDERDEVPGSEATMRAGCLREDRDATRVAGAPPSARSTAILTPGPSRSPRGVSRSGVASIGLCWLIAAVVADAAWSSLVTGMGKLGQSIGIHGTPHIL
jgi:hypothetical protein